MRLRTMTLPGGGFIFVLDRLDEDHLPQDEGVQEFVRDTGARCIFMSTEDVEL